MDALLIKGWMQSATIQVGCGIKNTQSITSRQSESFRQSKRERAAVCEILSDMCGINNATFNVLPPSDAPFEQVLRNCRMAAAGFPANNMFTHSTGAPSDKLLKCRNRNIQWLHVKAAQTRLAQRCTLGCWFNAPSGDGL